MRRVLVLLAAVTLTGHARAAEPEAASTARGGEAVRNMALTPPGWFLSAYDGVWKQWGLTTKPTDHDRAVRERYGLLPKGDGPGLPVGLVKARGLLGEGVSVACALCHTGAVAGRTYVGLGNMGIDFQSMSADLNAASGLRIELPFRFSYARGTIDAVSPAGFLMRFRDPELNLRPEVSGGELPRDVLSRPPAWWQLKKKKTRDWTGAIDARSARADLITLLHPFHTADRVKGQEPTFRDIHAFVLSVQPPAYPFPIDRAKAARGEAVFRDNCAKCHGTYGERWTYPNKVVPLTEIGTDPVLAEAVGDREVEYLNTTWLAREPGPDGRPYRFHPARGYQAPPLDGVWATAPYFHNASVPTLYHVLNSTARPAAFTRSYRTAEADFDKERVGVKFTAVGRPPDPRTPYRDRRDVYDTAQRGHSNGGHTYGDDLTDDERAAVIEYLKTL